MPLLHDESLAEEVREVLPISNKQHRLNSTLITGAPICNIWQDLACAQLAGHDLLHGSTAHLLRADVVCQVEQQRTVFHRHLVALWQTADTFGTEKPGD